MADVVTPARPALVTLRDVELVTAGTWPAMTGEATFTAEDLAAAVAAQDDPAIRTPIIKLGHVDPRFDGEPAVGRVENLRLSANGQTLIGDLVGVPAWLAEILPSAFPSRSIEGFWDFVTLNGNSHPFVLTALALLGVQLPAVEGLEDIAALYGVAAAQLPVSGRSVVVTLEAPMPRPVALSVNTEDVRRAYYDGPGSGWMWWVREIQLDPAQLIVENDEDGELYRVPYAIAADGTVTFSDPVRVDITYVDQAVNASRAQRVTFASRAESRPGDDNGPPGPEEVSMTPEQLAALGLPEDATNEQIIEQLNALGAIAAAERDALRAAAETPEPAAPELPDGVVAIDATALEELRVAASDGRDARRILREQDRDRFLGDAVKAGKFTPSRLAHFQSLYEADEEGTRELVTKLAANTVPVTEVGHAGPGDQSVDDELYALLYGAEKGA